ncbi:MAG: hypothetical protein LBR57_02450 [Alistipes sp.]|jgi:plasmid stabilization system protein ParE|nr:hypothetical protein [Alistipes sp.]
MRRVVISRRVNQQIYELERYLQQDFHFSKQAARRRSGAIKRAILRLGNPFGEAALCRFRKWRDKGYRCVSFDGWVFAYEIVQDGVAVQDMAHSSLLSDVVY